MTKKWIIPVLCVQKWGDGDLPFVSLANVSQPASHRSNRPRLILLVNRFKEHRCDWSVGPVAGNNVGLRVFLIGCTQEWIKVAYRKCAVQKWLHFYSLMLSLPLPVHISLYWGNIPVKECVTIMPKDSITNFQSENKLLS